MLPAWLDVPATGSDRLKPTSNMPGARSPLATTNGSCFAAQQAAEKAAKAAHAALGQEAWGHVITELLDALRPHEPAIDEPLLDRARALDKLYIPTRYPNGLASGAPADFYTRPEAERAIGDAEAVLAICRRMLSRS